MMNDDGASRDAAERAAALDTARSFIVQAPAGSGKTELLIQRYLALLARVDRPESIVAMTFTRKAAGEIRERILGALRDAGPTQPSEPHRAATWRLARAVLLRDAALGWGLVAHAARLQVHTIDALCMALMRQAPLTAKLGALPQPTEHAESLYAEAARAELDDAGAHAASWRRLLEHVDNDADRLVDLIAGMLGKREQWLRHLVTDDNAALRAALEQALESEIGAVVSALDALLPHAIRVRLAVLSQYAARKLAEADAEHPFAPHVEQAALPPTNVQGLAHWQAIADWLLTADGALLRRVDVRHGFAPKGKRREAGHAERDERKRSMQGLVEELAAVPGLAAALDAVRTLPPPRYDDAAWSFIEALLDVLPRAAARLSVVFAQHGRIDFSEATLVTLRALKTDEGASDLLLSLDARIEHLLVDEFQDTSLAQCDLIGYLTAGWTAGDGRTLFVVGDAMQSIYRFRDANVGLFLEAQRSQRVGGVAVEPLTLSRNFRAQRALVEWVNGTFPHVLPPRDAPARGAVAFKPAQAARRESFEPAVTLDFALDDVSEAEMAVTRIRAAQATDAALTIAVLVRKRTDLSQLLPALRAARISFAAVELDRLSERQAMLDLAALTHALIQPEDRAAWLAALRAPWCGLSLADLFAIDEACGEGCLVDAVVGPRVESIRPRLSPAGRIGFERFTAAVAPALHDRGRAPLSTMVRGVWLALGGPACVAEPIDLVAAERVFALIAEHAVGADLPDWPAFCTALDALHAEPEIDASTRVQVMTLHRAKGLEFDVVIMPGLSRATRPAEPQLLLWRERAAGLLLAPIRARGLARGNEHSVDAYLRSLDADEDDAEVRRLLYVGCTRAKRSLHLSAALDVERDADGSARWKTPARKTLLETLWPALDLPAVPAHRPAPQQPPPEVGVPLLRLPIGWRLPSPPESAPAAAQPAVRAEREVIEFDWVRETARQIGVVAHRLLRRMAEGGLERWTRERAGAERARVERELGALGFTGAEAGTAVEQVLAAIENTLGDPRGRWLFDSRHLDARSEYALTEWRDGAFLHRVLDRTFVDADGIRWIVDFKLSRHEGTDLEAFLDRECERYRAQLESYAAAMGALDGRPIRLALYFPLLAGWREWPAPMRA
ncbi:MAG: DNA helicase UvrD [Betaproteobacteria bacterium]|nr:MAG: DNA helicase UvrD [Betaproteobacteria bacterium]